MLGHTENNISKARWVEQTGLLWGLSGALAASGPLSQRLGDLHLQYTLESSDQKYGNFCQSFQASLCPGVFFISNPIT